MNSIKVGDKVFIKCGEWEGMTGVITSVWEVNCVVLLRSHSPETLFPSTILISIKDLGLVK